jgi:uncharacterized membrane protein YfcA
MPPEDMLLAALIGAFALLYASVGHGGASGYLAAMALFGVAPAVMKPTALALNVLVAGLATYQFARAGAIAPRLLWPLILASIPCAYLGGRLQLPVELYKPLVGAVLVYAAWQSLRAARADQVQVTAQPARWVLFATGAALGLLSGLTGVGGGIFLSPLLLFLGWAPLRTISGTSAAFILVNSIAGLFGLLSHHPVLPDALPLWALAAVIGGYIGARFGAARLGNVTIRRVLSAVLLVAGIKMLSPLWT